MATVLVRLKLALLKAGLATAGIQGRLGAAFSLFVAVCVGLTFGAGLLAIRLLDGGAATDAASGAMGFVLAIWVLGPIVAAGSEGTLDPDRLAPFPLTRRQLMPGLLLSSLIGFGGLVSAILFLALFAAMVPASPLALVTVAGLACHLLLCAATSRLVGTLLSGATRNRRWRDVALLAGPLLALFLNVGAQLLSRSLTNVDGSIPDPDRFDRARTIGRIAGGPAASAVGLAREGRAGAALLALAAGVALLVAVVWAWGAVLDRALTSGAGSGVRAGRAPRPLRPKLLAFLPPGRLGAVAAKDLRLSWRDPRQRVALFGILFAAAVPVFSLRALASTSPRVVLLAALPAFILGTQSTNQYGFDGPAHWVSVATGDDPRPELVGKNLARLLIALPSFALALAGLSLRAGSVEFAVPAVGLAAAGFGIAMGLGNWFSVTSPVPLPDSAANVFSAGNTGQGLAAAGPAIAVLFGGMLLVSPLLVAIFLAGHSALVLYALGFAGIVIGVAAWRLGTSVAVRAVQHRQPELLAELSVRA
ncbi:MAG TPA: hypothetical protein VM933_07005 [Acidimicrobiales bacterium]|nr:hypothetical protein [Acidimicrobiales bacterium]